jgi:hypothetical protein
MSDFTDRYNTALTPKEERDYQAWGKEQEKITGKNPAKDTYDYDMRGAWKAGAVQSDNQHWPDQWKKPNEPTFSNQSIYHGVDGYKGGEWVTGADGQYIGFKPSETNVSLNPLEDLMRHFQTEQRGIQLILPQVSPSTSPLPGGNP